MSRNSGLKTNTTFDIYRWYVAKMLKENPGFWTEYDGLTRKKGIYILCKKVNGKTAVHMTYTCFRAILEKNNTKAKEALIRGERYSLGSHLGYLLARRVERNFARPKVNIIETAHYRRNNPDKPDMRIYHTDDDYCRIAWHKLGDVKNESVYEFKPCKEFRLGFSASLQTNPSLKYKYLFFPVLDRAAAS